MTSVAASAAAAPTQPEIDAKILKDLETLTEKIDLCNSILRPGGGDPAPSVKSDETILSVIGFLEACAPRMVELVEASAMGAVSEHVLEKCLEVNDRLTKQLEDIETAALIETPASTTAAAAPPVGHDLLLNDDSEGSGRGQPPLPPGGGKTTGEDDEEEIDFGGDQQRPDDPFENVVLEPTTTEGAAATTQQGGIPLSKSEDEFDDFFKERSKSNGSNEE